MFEIIIKIIGLACASYLFVNAEPLINIKTYFKIGPESPYINFKQHFILKLVNCCLCSGFWIGLIFTQSIILGAIISILAEYISIKILR